MRLFNFGKSEESEAARQRCEASIASVRSGGLPLNAQERLQEQSARQSTATALFTSDFSVNELLAVRRSGYEAVGQVMGSSIFQMTGPFSSGVSGELQFLTQAYNDVRQRALGRLQQEAVLLGATHVVGVRLKQSRFAWGEGLLELTAIGTAVRESTAKRSKTPALSALSGTELWTLHQAGYSPVGLVVGNCAYYGVGTQMPSITVPSRPGAYGWGESQERRDYTQAVYGARAQAMGRMEQQARELRAEGVVGVTVEVETHRTSSGTTLDIYCHFVAVGTAVIALSGRASSLSPEITLALT